MAVRVTKDNFDELVLKSELPVLVDVYSDSCIPCKKMAPVVEDIKDNYEGRIEVYKLNSNYDADICEKYEVLSNPTLILFKGGEEVDRRIGFTPYANLEEWIRNYL